MSFVDLIKLGRAAVAFQKDIAANKINLPAGLDSPSDAPAVNTTPPSIVVKDETGEKVVVPIEYDANTGKITVNVSP